MTRAGGGDWWGNVTFAAGLIAVLAGITYGIQPYGGHTMGWTSPLVIGLVGGGLAMLAIFGVIETRVAEPMFRLPCSGSARSRRGTWPTCWPVSAGAG